MRILLTADPMLPVPPRGYGGIERIVDALIRHYRQMGHTVGLVSHPGSTVATDWKASWSSLSARGANNTLANTWTLFRAVQRFGPDILHSFSRLGYLLPILSSRRPVVMSYQRHTGGRQIKLAAKIGGKRLHFTGCSEFIARQGRAGGGRWYAIPNFIEPDRFTFVPDVPKDAPLVFLSRLDDIKGPDLAIAIARQSRRRLIIAGNRAEIGPQRLFFDREILPWIGHEGIEWIGEVNDEQKNALLGSAAALVVPIRWDEPFGIVFAEALACGTPVITSPRGAAPEIVVPNQTGYLIDTIDEGVRAVSDLQKLSRRACRDDVIARFSVSSVAQQYLGLYQLAIGTPPATGPASRSHARNT
jgi:glycosyltransferase involved in cell wall biosynthesis